MAKQKGKIPPQFLKHPPRSWKKASSRKEKAASGKIARRDSKMAKKRSYGTRKERHGRRDTPIHLVPDALMIGGAAYPVLVPPGDWGESLTQAAIGRNWGAFSRANLTYLAKENGPAAIGLIAAGVVVKYGAKWLHANNIGGKKFKIF